MVNNKKQYKIPVLRPRSLFFHNVILALPWWLISIKNVCLFILIFKKHVTITPFVHLLCDFI